MEADERINFGFGIWDFGLCKNWSQAPKFICGKNKFLPYFRFPQIYLWGNPKSKIVNPKSIDRLLFYFTGHGFAQDVLNNADELVGFFLPQDARPDENTWLSMLQLHDALIKLPCRHLLILLDCCFAGTFRWAGIDKTSCKSRFLPRNSNTFSVRFGIYPRGL
jgi:hypothetical protein